MKVIQGIILSFAVLTVVFYANSLPLTEAQSADLRKKLLALYTSAIKAVERIAFDIQDMPEIVTDTLEQIKSRKSIINTLRPIHKYIYSIHQNRWDLIRAIYLFNLIKYKNDLQKAENVSLSLAEISLDLLEELAQDLGLTMPKEAPEGLEGINDRIQRLQEFFNEINVWAKYKKPTTIAKEFRENPNVEETEAHFFERYVK